MSCIDAQLFPGLATGANFGLISETCGRDAQHKVKTIWDLHPFERANILSKCMDPLARISYRMMSTAVCPFRSMYLLAIMFDSHNRFHFSGALSL